MARESDKPIPTASQTVGPFFAFALNRPEWADLTEGGAAKGETIRIEGRIVDGDGAPVRDAFVEVWQANAAGRYAHPEDDREDKPLDPNFRGFGRAPTGEDGVYGITTVRPGQVPGRGNALQAPHILVSIFARGLLKRLVTRIYFEDEEAANATDPVLNSIEDLAVRKTLIAARRSGGGGDKPGAPPTYRFDIVLQGENETAFFDL
ncbi:MAG TPA: protocatechuate 3,4-dioxygenase subunit alpha [Stellaceae bacterium]|jgi:protocatechuate 3,4-dioxygenase alpha subunit